MTADELLSKVGTDFLINYYNLLCDRTLRNYEIVNRITEDYTLHSKRTRVSKGRKLIREFPDFVNNLIQ